MITGPRKLVAECIAEAALTVMGDTVPMGTFRKHARRLARRTILYLAHQGFRPADFHSASENLDALGPCRLCFEYQHSIRARTVLHAIQARTVLEICVPRVGTRDANELPYTDVTVEVDDAHRDQADNEGRIDRPRRSVRPSELGRRR